MLRLNRISTSLLVLALTFLTAGPLLAQGEWRTLDIDTESGFGTPLLWPRSGADLFFSDAERGYYYTFVEDGTDRKVYFRTTDGGSTWTEIDEPIPIPHRFLSGGLGVAIDGFFREPGSQSWLRPQIPTDDTNHFEASPNPWVATSAAAANTSIRAILFQLYGPDQGTDSVPYGPRRLAYSFDSGSTWRFTDYITIFGTTLQYLHDTTTFGAFPAPEAMSDTTSIGWHRLLRVRADSTIVVLSKAFGEMPSGRENHYYVGVLKPGPAPSVATWRKLPYVEPLFPPPAAPLRIEMLSDTSIFAIAGSFENLSNPNDVTYTLWKSFDLGQTWDTVALPSYVDYRSLTFTSNLHGVASNARTFDGGLSWQQWSHPFGSSPLFSLADSASYMLANRFSLFARSTDAGVNWDHNASGAVPYVAHPKGRLLLIGRAYQSILRSSDSGATWTDLGAANSLPDSLSTIYAFAFPDTVDAPERVLAIGSFVSPSGELSVRQLESNDTGVTWVTGERMSALAGASARMDMVFIETIDNEQGVTTGFIASTRGLLASTDRGFTWEVRNQQHAFLDLAMADVNVGTALTADGLYYTDDGGFSWRLVSNAPTGRPQPLGIAAFADDRFEALYSGGDENRSWGHLEANGDVNLWETTVGENAAYPMDVAALWSDTTHGFAVGRYGRIMLSRDNGTSFETRVNADTTFTALAGYVIAGADLDNLLLVGPGNRAGIYYMERNRPVSVPRPGIAGERLPLRVMENPVLDGTLDLEIGNAHGPLQLLVINTAGQAVLSTVAGANQRNQISVAQLPSGTYFVTLLSQTGSAIVPVQIAR